MIITRRHLFTVPGHSERPGFCRGGSRRWMRAHGIDWRTFVRQGIDESEFLTTGDPLALALVKWAHECEEADDGR